MKRYLNAAMNRAAHAGLRASWLLTATLVVTASHAQTTGAPSDAPAHASPAAPDGGVERSPKLSKVDVKQNADGAWVAVCEVQLSGGEFGTRLVVEAITEPPEAALGQRAIVPLALDPKPGTQTVTAELERPDIRTEVYNPQLNVIERTHKPAQTEWVIVRLNGFAKDGKPFEETQKVKQTIRWPEKRIWDADRTIRRDGPAKALATAVQWIDESRRDSLSNARMLLERLLLKDSQMTGAYIEMARVSMKTNWGPEGLLQARRYLDSALSIDPQSVNAFILRGYVSARQGRYKEAEADFANAAKSNPPNLWLWSNWGEVLAMQGQRDEAIKMYLKGTSHPPTHDTYDRAREDAYAHLISLYEDKRDLDAADTMHKERVRDFPHNGCYVVRYAFFKLQERGDADGTISLLNDFNQADCDDDNTSQEALGMAYYMKWAQASEPQRADFLNRARVYFPIGARLFYSLESSGFTANAAKALVKSGEVVDQKDNNGMTALAYAVQHRAYEVAGRLIKIGANPAATIGEQGVPLALMPVFQDDVEGVRRLKDMGVNYARIAYQGMTAMAYARKVGNAKMVEVLGGGGPRT